MMYLMTLSFHILPDVTSISSGSSDTPYTPSSIPNTVLISTVAWNISSTSTVASDIVWTSTAADIVSQTTITVDMIPKSTTAPDIVPSSTVMSGRSLISGAYYLFDIVWLSIICM